MRHASLLATLFLSACGPKAGNEQVLNIYSWSEYIGESTIEDFQRETGIKVNYDTVDSNEALQAKLLAGHTGYDIVVPSSHWAKLQIGAGLFLKLDKSRIPNLARLDPWVMRQLATMDPENAYMAPWLGGFTTIGVNTDRVKAALGPLPMPDNVWDLLFKPEYASRLRSCGISVLDSADEVFPAALLYLGRYDASENPADYADAARLLAGIRPYITLFSSASYMADLASGSLCLSMGWNGDIGTAARRARESGNGEHIQAFVPRTGAIMFFDVMAIPRDAEHVANAYKWIDFIYRPDVQAGIVNKVAYAGPVRAADRLIRPELFADKAVFVQGDDLNHIIPPSMVSNETRRLRTRLYTTFKTGL